jgi:methyl-accepting chemotaxis protein
MKISIARGLAILGIVVSLSFLGAVAISALAISKVEIGSEANSLVTTYLTVAAALAAIAFLSLVTGLVAIRRRVVQPVTIMTRYMGTLASGSYDRDVPYADRSDEIGQMAQSMEMFRSAIVEGNRTRDAADEERRRREDAETGDAERREREDEQRRVVIDGLSKGLNHLADGDLTYTLNEPFVEKYDALRAVFNRAVEALSQTLTNIAGSTDNVRTGSTEIARAADDLSKRTEQQAAALEETAAALDEITTTVRSSTEAAQEAGQMIDEAKGGTQKSGVIVKNAITAMERIEQSSDKIGQIIGVIDEIAFQTNLLALNAGVEAARAGDAGRGFAVVAQEVRELAQRTAKAAKEIKDLVTNSATEVGDGVSLVSQTGEALQEIEEQVLRINDRVASIITSSQEQSAGLQQINTAINQMDQVTQQNAAMVEQTNAACHSLNTESGKLNGLVSRFGTSGRATVAPTPVTARPLPSPPIAIAATARPDSKPVDSPARNLGKKLASAFGMGGGAATVSDAVSDNDDWTEF